MPKKRKDRSRGFFAGAAFWIGVIAACVLVIPVELLIGLVGLFMKVIDAVMKKLESASSRSSREVNADPGEDAADAYGDASESADAKTAAKGDAQG